MSSSTTPGAPKPRRVLAVGAVIAVVAAIAAAFVGAPGASAHEVRTVGNGNYALTIGFLNEPAYEGLENGLYFNVVQIGGDNAPVEDLQETLQAEVTMGASTMPLTLSPLEGDQGSYVARFVPTRTGDYSFRLSGAIGEETINEEFRSSPNTFDSVQPVANAQFPDQLPSTAELSAALRDAEDDAASARTLAAIGIGVGAFGVLLALFVFGMSLQRRRS